MDRKRVMCPAEFLSIVLTIVCLLQGRPGFSEERMNEPVLAERYSAEVLKSVVLTAEEWHPWPKAAEREAWESIPEMGRRAQIELGERYLGYAWPALPATLFLQFARMGNRSNYEAPHFDRRDALSDLVLAECMEGDGRFIDDITNGIWAICEESYWGVPAHIGMQAAGSGLPDVEEPTVDLFVGETANVLAWTLYLLEPQLNMASPLLTRRIRYELERRLLVPNLDRTDFHWMGFDGTRVNNWNPWCNSNWLTCILLFEKDTERRVKALHKSLSSLDYFIGPYPADGGCDEGPGYWTRAGASLFDCLELLYSASDGKINVYDEPLIRDIGTYIYKAHIAGNYFVNFADASARVSPDGDLVYRYGKRITDTDLMKLGAYFGRIRYEANPLTSSSMGRRLPALFNMETLMRADARQPMPGESWFPHLEVFTARDKAGSAEGFFVAAKGGHNAESHNHNDVGNFIVYIDGRPAIIDVGVETYSRKTFSPQRYEIWTMQSAFHNLPTAGGVMQRAGREFAARDVAFKSGGSSVELSLDIAGAYPEEANIAAWRRTVRLNRGKDVRVIDRYELKENASEITFSLMTPCNVSVESPGKIKLEETLDIENNNGFTVFISYDSNKLSVSTEDITVEDRRLQSVWRDRLTRIVLSVREPRKKGSAEIRITRE